MRSAVSAPQQFRHLIERVDRIALAKAPLVQLVSRSCIDHRKAIAGLQGADKNARAAQCLFQRRLERRGWWPCTWSQVAEAGIAKTISQAIAKSELG